jgi:hypothetical protein
VASEDYSVGTITNIEVNGTARRFAGNINKYTGEVQNNSSGEMWGCDPWEFFLLARHITG